MIKYFITFVSCLIFCTGQNTSSSNNSNISEYMNVLPQVLESSLPFLGVDFINMVVSEDILDFTKCQLMSVRLNYSLIKSNNKYFTESFVMISHLRASQL